jgi:adenylate kinase family enzyme
MDPNLQHPFCLILSGPSQSGKTTLVKEILKNKDKLIVPKIERVVYAYAEYQSDFAGIDAEFVPEIPSPDIFDKNSNNLLIIDDFQDQLKNMTNLFTKYSHHRNLSVILLLQNPFASYTRTISLNSHYFIFMKNPRDKSQINHLARQIAPGKSNRIIEAYEDATSTNFGYLFIDLKPNTSEQMRYRTDIFDMHQQRVYLI